MPKRASKTSTASKQLISQPHQIKTKKNATGGPGGEDQVYKENTYMANQARRVIFSMLKDDNSDQSPAAANEKFGNQFFHKSVSTIQLFAQIVEYGISTPHKTIARLERESRYPSVAAISG